MKKITRIMSNFLTVGLGLCLIQNLPGFRATSQAAIVFCDGDAVPATLTVSQSSIGESGGATAQLIFNLGGPVGNTTRLTLQLSGSASSGIDFNALPSQVVIPAGQTRVTLDVTPIADSLVEGSETLAVQITASDNVCVFVGSPNNVILSIVDGAGLSLTTALDDANLVWTGGGSLAWQPQTAVSHDGVDAAQSGAIFDRQESGLQTSVTGPGTLTFWWRVSSEQDFDYLRFHIDDVMQQQISGEVNWQQRSYSIGAGSHTLGWRYVKDPNTVGGQDRGWVDQVSFLPATGVPVIASQPADQVLWEGANTVLQAVAVGAAPLSQQWYFNETAIDGATNASLVISNVLPVHVGGYRLVASNALGGPVTSAVARLTLTNNGPVTRILLFVDSPVASPFEAALAGLGLSYERVFNEFELDTAVNGANLATTLVVVDAPQNQYNFSSFTSFVNGGGRLLIGAHSMVVNSPLSALLKVVWESRSSTPLTAFSWGGSPLFTGLGSSLSFVEIGFDEDAQRLHAAAGAYAVAGFTGSPTPGAAAVVIGNNGRTIVNGFWIGGANPNASAVQFAQNEILFLTGPNSATAPLIRIQPANQTALAGGGATFRVVAWGAAPLSYQWFLNETTLIAEATAATLTLPSVQLADAGNYRVVVSNAYGQVTSSPVLLTVATSRPVPTILLFTDFALTSPYEPALAARAYPVQRFTDEASFDSAVAAANPDATLVVVDGINSIHTFPSMPGYVSRGGRAILQYWNLTSGSPLASAFQVSVGQELTTPQPVYDWSGSLFFDGISRPLIFAEYFNRDGLRLQPLTEAQAVAGFVPAKTANQAALVVGNSGRTIVHGIWLEAVGSFNDAVRLARNELDFLIVPLPPTTPFITTPPQQSLTVQGSTARLAVSAGGSLPLSYQWRRDGSEITAATNEDFRISGAQLTDSGSYDVVVGNAHGAVTSSVAAVVVSKIGPVTKAVLFRDGPNPSPYAEALVNLDIPFQEVANDADLAAAVAAADPASTMVVVDATWELHYLSALERFIPAGGRAILQDWTMNSGKRLASLFQVTIGQAFFFPSPVYDWGRASLFGSLRSPLAFTDRFNLAGRLMQPMTGAQAVAGYTSNPSVNQAAIVVGNGGRSIVNGFVLEEITLFAESVRLAQNEIEYLNASPPSITVQPTNQAVILGSAVTLSVTVTGSAPLFYQWHFNNGAIPGASNASYAIASVQANHLGAYSVVVTNRAGAATSEVAWLEMAVTPVFVQAPLSQAVAAGGNVTFSVQIEGNPPPFSYEWRKTAGTLFTNRMDSGERTCFFTLTNVDANLAGTYELVIRNPAAPAGVSSALFTLTVLADTDADGVPDAFDLNPGGNEAGVDADHDGRSNLDEYIAGTDPTNELSYLKIEGIAVAGSATISFQTMSNKTYTVEYTDNLGGATWSKLADVVARSTNLTQSVTDPAPATHRSYRLVTPRQR